LRPTHYDTEIKMAQIRVYDTITGKPIGMLDKDEAHRLAKAAYGSSQPQPHKHAHLGIMLLEGRGNFLTSTRDFLTDSNPDMIDKTLGGHKPANYESAAAILNIASREFRIPTAIVNRQELENIIINHPELLSREAFLTEVDFVSDFDSVRTTPEGKEWTERCMQHVFIGVYDGQYKAQERSSLRPIPLDQLNEYLKASKNSARATGDLRRFLTDYDRQLRNLIKTIQQEKGSGITEEVIEYYDMLGNLVGTMPRKKVHEPIKEAYFAGTPQPHKHRHVGGIIVGDNGEIYVQIRSNDKSENPGMYDKLVGGHIPCGDSPIVASYHEFIEEMAIPIAVYDELTWLNLLRNCPEATRVQAICRAPELVTNFNSTRIMRDGRSFVEICDQYFTVGRYGGSFELVDKESAGVFEYKNRDQLRKEMEERPEKFTDDLKYMVTKFWDELVPLKQRVS
jgi:isopentenyldiphosphate isomerase